MNGEEDINSSDQSSKILEINLNENNAIQEDSKTV